MLCLSLWIRHDDRTSPINVIPVLASRAKKGSRSLPRSLSSLGGCHQGRRRSCRLSTTHRICSHVLSTHFPPVCAGMCDKRQTVSLAPWILSAQRFSVCLELFRWIFDRNNKKKLSQTHGMIFPQHKCVQKKTNKQTEGKTVHHSLPRFVAAPDASTSPTPGCFIFCTKPTVSLSLIVGASWALVVFCFLVLFRLFANDETDDGLDGGEIRSGVVLFLPPLPWLCRQPIHLVPKRSILNGSSALDSLGLLKRWMKWFMIVLWVCKKPKNQHAN